MKALKRVSSNYSSIILILVVLAFFWKVFFKVFIPLPGGFITGIYYPWLDYKWGYEVGVPVENPITADVVSFTFPMQTYAIHLIKSGEFPLWNPLILAGVPLFANFQSAPLSVTNFVYWIFDDLNAWTAKIILQHVISAMGMFSLLKLLKVKGSGAFLGSLLFAFSGFNTIWSQWNAHVLTASFIPILILFIQRWIDTKQIRYLILFSILIPLQIFSGYPQIVIYTVMSLGIWWSTWFIKSRDIKTTIPIILFGLLGAAMAAVQLLPASELLNTSQRAVEPHPFEWAFLPWNKLITFIAPDYFGNHATGNYWGPQDYTSNTGFVSVIGLCLAGIAILSKWKNRYVFSFGLIALLGLVLSFPTPISIFLWDSGIFGMQAASAHRALILWVFGISALAGFGLYEVISNRISRLLVFAVVGFILLLFYLNAPNTVAIRNLVIPSFAFVTILFFSIIRKPFYWIIIAILLLELYWFWDKFTPFSPRHLAYPTTPVIEYLQKQEKPFRTTGNKVIPINFRMAYEIETLEGYDAIYPSDISRFIAKVNDPNSPDNAEQRRYAMIDDTQSKLLDIANTKYVIVMKEDVSNYDERFKVVFEDKSVFILENTSALPRAVVQYSDGSISTNVSYKNYTSLGSKLDVVADKDGKLIVSDLYYPGWKVYVDGKEEVINRSNKVFRELEIKEGKHSVEFVYEPESFKKGILISLVALCLALGSAFVLRYTYQR